MGVNITAIKTSSNGAWQDDNPLDCAFPLLIVQTMLILFTSRLIVFLLKPLRQPKVIAEIIGGIILGPSALGRNQDYMQRIFPKWSTPTLESIASIGLLFFLFLVGLELDLTSIRRRGRKAVAIAAAGISIPFILGIGDAFLLRKAVQGVDRVDCATFIVFMGVALSITAFPVLARILAELKLLTTRVGETAMAAAALNDVVAWILLAIAVALAGDGSVGSRKSPMVSLWVLLSGVVFVLFMMVVIRPAMKWVSRRCSPRHDVVNESCICLTLAGVMVSGFVTDLIGIHSIFGAFVFGLTIPKEGKFAERLMERIEDFVSGLLLPLYFASSGLKTDISKIRGAEAWGLLILVITTACIGKIIGTFVVAMLYRIPTRESLTLGLLMNTKGLVELIVLNIGKEKKVLNDEVFAILVLMALFTTFMTTPTVMSIYKPYHKLQLSDSGSDQEGKGNELRLLACIHGQANVSSLIKLIELTRSGGESRVKVYLMNLVQLTERSSSILMVQRLRKNGFPFINRFRGTGLHDRVADAFRGYGRMGRVIIRPATAISSLPTMHEDICHVADQKDAALIVLPFHKQGRKTDGGDHDAVENVGHAWRAVNQRVLMEAPCSVAVLVDRGLGCGSRGSSEPTGSMSVCVMFFGGPDDREALSLAGRMTEQPAVKVTVTRFVEKQDPEGNGVSLLPSHYKRKDHYTFSTASINNSEMEKELDDRAVAEFRRKEGKGTAEYTEKVTSNAVDDVAATGRSGNYDLIVVGKGRCPTTTTVVQLGEREAEHAELGPVGDMLASSSQGINSSLLVIQQHYASSPSSYPCENPLSKNKP